MSHPMRSRPAAVVVTRLGRIEAGAAFQETTDADGGCEDTRCGAGAAERQACRADFPMQNVEHRGDTLGFHRSARVAPVSVMGINSFLSTPFGIHAPSSMV